MAQITLPTEFSKQIVLLSHIIEKNSEMGADSPIAEWLIENKIDLVADQQAGVDAAAQDVIHAKEEAAGNMAIASRNADFLPVLAFIRKAALVLKDFYVTKQATLADWGLPITGKGRIVYPSSFEKRSRLATAFFTKLASYGENKSPLSIYLKNSGADVADLTEKNRTAADSNTKAKAAQKAAEKARELRDNLWKDALLHIQMIRNYLKSINPNNPRALGEWGFVVDEGKRGGKERKVRFTIGQTKVVENVKIGSVILNAGPGEAIVYRGSGTNGAVTVLQNNEKMGVVKGYNTITVVNPSTLETLALLILPPEK